MNCNVSKFSQVFFSLFCYLFLHRIGKPSMTQSDSLEVNKFIALNCWIEKKNCTIQQIATRVGKRIIYCLHARELIVNIFP